MDGGECVYCGWVNRDTYMDMISRIEGKKAEPRKFSIDHIIPQIQGGSSWIWNLAYCCTPCNSRKNGRTPTEANMPLRDGRFHHTAAGLFFPKPLHQYSGTRPYDDYIRSFEYGEPFNTEFIKIQGRIPYVEYPEHRQVASWEDLLES